MCKCEFCGKPFNSIGSKLCVDCMKLVDETYVKVRKYIYQNPGRADFASIVEDTEVPENALNYLIDQGRLMINNGRGGGVKCRACGAETEEGILCERCRNKLISEKLISGISQPKQQDHAAAGARIKPMNTQK